MTSTFDYPPKKTFWSTFVNFFIRSLTPIKGWLQLQTVPWNYFMINLNVFGFKLKVIVQRSYIALLCHFEHVNAELETGITVFTNKLPDFFQYTILLKQLG